MMKTIPHVCTAFLWNAYRQVFISDLEHNHNYEFWKMPETEGPLLSVDADIILQ